MTWSKILFLTIGLALTGCMIPHTYYDPVDPYVIGLRWFDRGNYTNAIIYWDPLVEKGDCDAEYMTGLLHFLGRGKPQNNAQALALWRKAANANQQRAQWALGDIYYQNRGTVVHNCADCGVERDLVTALFWYRLFEKSANYKGEKQYVAMILPKILAEMTPEQVKKAEILVSEWKPSPESCHPRHLW
jgi:hypothetical protein